MSDFEAMFARPTSWAAVTLRGGLTANFSVRHLQPGIPFHKVTSLDPNATPTGPNLSDGLVQIEMFDPNSPEDDSAAYAVFEISDQGLRPKELEVGYDYRGNYFALDLIDIASRVTGIRAPAITEEQNRYL